MKLLHILCCAATVSASVYSQELTIEETIKKRDSLLAEIHEAITRSFTAGTATEEQVRAAALDLYSFRRDYAKTLSERLEWQGKIISSERELKASIEKRIAQGTATPIDALRASERVLAAEQRLLEMKVQK